MDPDVSRSTNNLKDLVAHILVAMAFIFIDVDQIIFLSIGESQVAHRVTHGARKLWWLIRMIPFLSKYACSWQSSQVREKLEMYFDVNMQTYCLIWLII